MNTDFCDGLGFDYYKTPNNKKTVEEAKQYVKSIAEHSLIYLLVGNAKMTNITK